jgi:hypothetical protein
MASFLVGAIKANVPMALQGRIEDPFGGGVEGVHVDVGYCGPYAGKSSQ